MRIIAIVQARMSSNRLPGKVFMPLNGRPVIEHVYERVSKSNVDEVVIATSTEHSDDVIADFCDEKEIKYFRGDLNNVLSRYYHAAKLHHADTVVRITSDCPMYDATVLNAMIPAFVECDYMSNCINRTYPRGLDTELFTFTSLEESYHHAKTPYEYEHVTPYIREKSNFIRKNYAGNKDYSNHRWTLDTSSDYSMIKKVFSALGDNFNTDMAVKFLNENPSIFKINQHVEQKL